MDNEFLTVSEFANRAGVSTQSVYGRLKTDNNPLSEFLVLRGNKKFLKAEALEKVYGVLNEPTEDKKPIDSREYIDFLLHRIANLEEKNANLEKQLATITKEKDAEIASQNESLRNLSEKVAQIAQNALLTANQQQALAAAEKVETIQRKPFLKRLFGK